MRRVYILFLHVALAALLVLTAGDRAAAQAGTRCFAETGFCINADFRTYWEQNGGLPVFGLPLTEQRREVSRQDKTYYHTQRKPAQTRHRLSGAALVTLAGALAFYRRAQR